MHPTRFLILCLLAVPLLELPAAELLLSSQTGTASVDTVFQKFWTAGSPEDAAQLIDDILRTKISFEQAIAKLKAGRTYEPHVGTLVMGNIRTGGIDHPYAVNVP